MARSFTPAGLDGYTVAERDGYWFVRVAPGMTISFRWNDETQRHDIPTTHHQEYAIERRSTAKGAVAAAWAHKRFVENYDPKTRL